MMPKVPFPSWTDDPAADADRYDRWCEWDQEEYERQEEEYWEQKADRRREEE